MQRPVLFLALTLGASACAPEAPSERSWGEAHAPIVNGEVNDGDPAVVALTRRGGSFCTGTLIRHDVVLTAAHCLPPHVPVSDYNRIDVFFGTRVGGTGESIDVVDGWTHPDWNDDAYFYDIGLIRLKRPANIDPIPFRTAPMTGEVGTRVRITGFGLSQGLASDSGIKRVGTTTVVEVTPELFFMNGSPSAICSGDSGGPALVMRDGVEEVAGVNSRGDCTQSNIETNVHHYLDPIYAFLGEDPSASCEADGACGALCGAPDPDCLCATDGFCGEHCEDPTNDADCTTQCAADSTCNPDCPDETADPDCAPLCGADDGLCDPTCPAIDPDCDDVPVCHADGTCEASCAADPDCAPAAGPLDIQPDDGCRVSGGGGGGGDDDASWLWLAAFGLIAARRRRPLTPSHVC